MIAQSVAMVFILNLNKVLLKKLIPTMNTLKDMAVWNIVKTDGRWAPEAKREGLELI